MNRGNTLVYALLGLMVAALVGLCFAPLQYRACGHRISLAEQWFPKWDSHLSCRAFVLRADLDVYETTIDPTYQSKVKEWSDSDGIKFVATRTGDHWHIRVDRTPDLPGWYLDTGNHEVHFSEKGSATAQDPVLPKYPP